MRNFFTLNQDGNVTVDPAALTLLPYKALWDRDKTKLKKRAISELSYVFYMCDYKSYFADITDEEEKHNEVVRLIFEDPSKFKVDDKIQDALDCYTKDIPYSVRIMEDAKTGINALRDYFREVNLLEYDKSGKPIHDAAKLSGNLQKLASIIDNLDKLEDKVKRDMDATQKVQGGREKGIFEDPEF